MSLFADDGSATTKYFVAGKNWSEVSFPFPAFGSDAKRPGGFKSQALFSDPSMSSRQTQQSESHRWLGLIGRGDPKGAKINSVNEDSPAEKAGLKKGDVIALNNSRVSTYRDLLNYLQNVHIGEKVDVHVIRDGEPQTLQVTVARPPYAMLQLAGH